MITIYDNSGEKLMSNINVIPKINYVKEKDGNIRLTKSDIISYSDDCNIAGEYLASYIGLSTGKKGKVILSLDTSIKNKQAYEIDINKESIEIKGASGIGVFYGVQTLRQLLPYELETEKISENILLPCMVIKDEPQFEYRGFMLDSARHFFDVDTIKKLLDLMALHKLNKFHWHLSDDQGFRVEIAKYPRLTEIGSVRKRTVVKGLLLPFGKEYEEKVYGGYYTKADIKEIVEYAKTKYIDIIPEIDMPGHMTAALAAYPEYCCTGTLSEIPGGAGIYKDVLCVGNDAAIEFALDVLLEIGEMFPYKHLHIGGDEVPLARWKSCEKCREKMAQQGLKGERELQYYFTNIIVDKLRKEGYTVIGWDGILNKNLDNGVINQYWFPLAEKKTKEHLNKGRKTIFSPAPTLYLDYTFTQSTLRKTYNYSPYDKIEKKNHCNILGLEAPLWTEFVRDVPRMQWQTFPKLSAVSEAAWTAKSNKSFPDFIERLAILENRLDALGIKYASRELYSYDGRTNAVLSMFGLDHKANIEYKKYNKK